MYYVTLQTKYIYIHQNIENKSLEGAEELCENVRGYHLLSINSHEEQQLLEDFYNEMMEFHHPDTIYIAISLKKQVPLI